MRDESVALSALRGGRFLALTRRPHRVEVRRRGRDAFEFTLTPETPSFWRNYTLVSSEPIPLALAAENLAAAAKGDHAWVHHMKWHAPRKRAQGAKAGLIALAVFGIPYALVGGYALHSEAPSVDAKTFWVGLIVVAVIAAYIAWLDFFFGPVRKAIAKRVGERIGAKVSESDDLLDAGTWQVETDTGMSFLGVVYTNVLVGVTDIVVLLAGAFLPVAAVASALFLFFDR